MKYRNADIGSVNGCCSRGAGDTKSDDWYRLSPVVNQPVEFQFRADAGNPGEDPKSNPGIPAGVGTSTLTIEQVGDISG